ncbi:MAG: glycosyltransferase [Fibrobacterales bacterium]
MIKQKVSACIYGHHELDYPRNAQITALLKRGGFEVYLCHSRISFPFRHLSLIKQFLGCVRNVDFVFVTEGGHRLVPLLKIVSFFFRKKIVFDPFISRYNTRIEDRKLYPNNGFQSWICKWQDWSGCMAADALIFDTLQHKNYFYEQYGLKKPWLVVPVGIDEETFSQNAVFKKSHTEFRVLFYGTYIPLHGIQHIIEAAELLLPYSDISFVLVGTGQTYDEMKEYVIDRNITSIVQKPQMKLQDLVAEIREADVCLGIFDDGVKASNVVPNKVVQCAALSKPIITRDSDAIREYFIPNENIVLCDPANPSSIAEKILELYTKKMDKKQLGDSAREVFVKTFSQDALYKRFKTFVDEI